MDNCHLSNITKVKKNHSFAHAILGSMSLNNTNYVDHHVNDIVQLFVWQTINFFAYFVQIGVLLFFQILCCKSKLMIIHKKI
jgi:hypothetical protein